MKCLIWHLPGWAQRAITKVTGYRVTAFKANGRILAFYWRRWPR